MKPKDIQRIISSTDAQTASIEIVELFSKYQEEQDNKLYSEEEVIDLLQEMNDWPTIFDGRIDIREWFEQFKKK